jgi:RND family efflux transporter MFP subunit
VSLGFRVAGRIRTLAADQGRLVTAGQSVATLDTEEARRQMELAEASGALADAGVAKARADVDQLERTLALAGKEQERIRSLRAKQVASESALDETETRWAEARARLAAARAALVQAERSVVVGGRGTAVKQATLNDHELRSPIDGLVVRRHRESGDMVAAGTPVFTVVSLRKLWVRAWIDETALSGLREGQAARVVFRSEPGRSYRGRVDRVGHETDRQTHELLVDVELLERPERFAMGQRADVFVAREPS